MQYLLCTHASCTYYFLLTLLLLRLNCTKILKYTCIPLQCGWYFQFYFHIGLLHRCYCKLQTLHHPSGTVYYCDCKYAQIISKSMRANKCVYIIMHTYICTYIHTCIPQMQHTVSYHIAGIIKGIFKLVKNCNWPIFKLDACQPQASACLVS